MPAVTDNAQPFDSVRAILGGVVAEVAEAFTLTDLAVELAADEIGAVLVRDAHGVVGLLSERDLVTAIASGRDLDATSAAEAMTTDLVWAPPTATIREVGELMRTAGVRHVPIGDGRTAIGVVSMRDVLAVLLSDPA